MLAIIRQLNYALRGKKRLSGIRVITSRFTNAGDPFWSHSFRVCLVATIVVFAARSIGFANTEINYISALFHSALIVATGHFCMIPFVAAAMNWKSRHVPVSVRAVMGCVVGALPASLIAPVASWVLGIQPEWLNVGDTRADFIGDLSGRIHRVYFIYATLGTALWITMNYQWMLARLSVHQMSISDHAAMPKASEKAGISSSEQGLLKELPLPKRGAVVAISAEGHYVRVYTTAGSDLVLMRLKDAIDRMPVEDGLRVHRSHWVRKSAIVSLLEEPSKRAVKINTGEEFPISRSNLNLVRETMSISDVQSDS